LPLIGHSPYDRRVKHPAAVAASLVAVTFALAAFLLRGFQNPGFEGDGVGYYAPLASILVDRDLDLRDELAHLNPAYLRAAFMTPEGALGDPFPVGPAILWSPAVLLERALPPCAWLDAAPDTPIRTVHAAFAPRYARVVLWTNMLLVLAGGMALAGTLAVEFGPVIPAGAALAAVLGTPTFFYVLQDPSYGHTACFFAGSLLASAVLLDRRRRQPLELLGFLLGVTALMRTQDVLMGALLLPRLATEIRAHRGQPLRRWGGLGLRFAVPALVAFAPQMLFWQRIYGKPLLVPPGPDFLPPWQPHVVHLLFSTWNGAFLWSPVLLVGTLGLLRLRDPPLRLALLAAVLLEVYACAILADWWGGRAFGARRLVSIVPLAVVGLVCVADSLRRSPWRIAGLALFLCAACFWSERLALYQVEGLLPRNPGNAADYVRHYAPGTRHTFRYGYWDYPRLIGEVVEAEELLRSAGRHERGDP